MEPLINYHQLRLSQTNKEWHRYLLDKLDWSPNLLGLKGIRGVGKTTLLLQYGRDRFKEPDKVLYITVEHPWFYNHTLFETAEQWFMLGGKLLLIDEVHKYERWSNELKVINDGFPNMQVIFTSSSALEIFRGEADLSRRVIVRELHGLSFREYLNFFHDFTFEAITLDDIINHQATITRDITTKLKPLPFFQDYLRRGYFPFSKLENEELLLEKLLNVITTVLENDLTYVLDYSGSNIRNLKKLLAAVAESAPFEPNISRLASKLSMGRDTINSYLKALGDGRLLQLVNKPGKGTGKLQKPDKIYFENTNLAYSLYRNPDIGVIRETFFINQLRNAGHDVHLASKADFLIDQSLTFEVGGKNKSQSQIRGIDHGWLAKDNIEFGIGKTIPLWLFGFLY